MWVTPPAAMFSATAPTASPRLSPYRRRNRTLTASPPDPPGSTWFANVAATCTANSRNSGSRGRTEPSWLTVPAVQSSTVPAAASRIQARSAPATLSEPASSIVRCRTSSTTSATATPTESPVRIRSAHRRPGRPTPTSGSAAGSIAVTPAAVTA